MLTMLLAAGLFVLSLLIALQAVSDLLSVLSLYGQRQSMSWQEPGCESFLFLVPAHDEHLLISRTVNSLLAQDYPRAQLTVAVIADNCVDNTAELAEAAGATVLRRSTTTLRGKAHAISWALEQLPWRNYTAVVIVDADTLVESDYARQLSRWPNLASRALQTFDGMSNEFQNSLTRLAGLLTRNRYDIQLPLKTTSGLSSPVTGDGVVLGRAVLERFGWHADTITEGWELYARLTISGQRVDYAPLARLYAQETSSLEQSGTQRTRWRTGRREVLRLYWKQILRAPGLGLRQRLDLIAELGSPGPIMRAVLGIAGAIAGAFYGGVLAKATTLLFLSGVLQPTAYSLISLTRHPQPWQTLAAISYLPVYAVWRVGLAFGGILKPHRGTWVRTDRHIEPE